MSERVKVANGKNKKVWRPAEMGQRRSKMRQLCLHVKSANH
jgi:hypothetical protein